MVIFAGCKRLSYTIWWRGEDAPGYEQASGSVYIQNDVLSSQCPYCRQGKCLTWSRICAGQQQPIRDAIVRSSFLSQETLATRNLYMYAVSRCWMHVHNCGFDALLCVIAAICHWNVSVLQWYNTHVPVPLSYDRQAATVAGLHHSVTFSSMDTWFLLCCWAGFTSRLALGGSLGIIVLV